MIAGGLPEDSAAAYRIDSVIATLRPHFHYTLDENARNVRLTDAGINRVEETLGCGNLFAPRDANLAINTAAQDALYTRTPFSIAISTMWSKTAPSN